MTNRLMNDAFFLCYIIGSFMRQSDEASEWVRRASAVVVNARSHLEGIWDFMVSHGESIIFDGKKLYVLRAQLLLTNT